MFFFFNTGTKLGATANSNIVKLGDAECKVTSQSATKLVCTVGSHKAGLFNVSVHVNNVGFAGCDAQFTYALSVDSVSPSSGNYSITFLRSTFLEI